MEGGACAEEKDREDGGGGGGVGSSIVADKDKPEAVVGVGVRDGSRF